MEEYFEVLYEHIHFLCNRVEEILRVVLLWLKQLPQTCGLNNKDI